MIPREFATGTELDGSRVEVTPTLATRGASTISMRAQIEGFLTDPRSCQGSRVIAVCNRFFLQVGLNFLGFRFIV